MKPLVGSESLVTASIPFCNTWKIQRSPRICNFTDEPAGITKAGPGVENEYDDLIENIFIFI